MSSAKAPGGQRNSGNERGKEKAKEKWKSTELPDGKELAPQVCYSCKLRKRKCSKELPACALCSRLFLKCEYEYTLSSNTEVLQVFSQNILPSSSASPLDLAIGSSLATAADLFSALSSQLQDQNSIGHPRQAGTQQNIATGIPEEVLDILILSGESVASVATSYFRTIDPWMPFLWAAQINHQLETMVADENIPLACLLLAMFLVTRPPPNASNSAAEHHDAYFKTKAMVAAMGGRYSTKIETAQASTLLVLYELGHGMIDEAQIGMATCIGLTRRVIGNPRKLSVASRKSSEARLWWSVVTLESYMNIGISSEDIYIVAGVQEQEPDFLNLALTLGLGQGLEEQRRAWQGGQHPCSDLPPFCRAARSGYLLGKTLDLLSRSEFDLIDEREVDALDAVLQNTVLGLLRQTVNTWEECCPAIRLALSALLYLHEGVWRIANGIPGKEYRKQAAEIAIRSTTRLIIDISYRFAIDVDFVEVSALPFLSMGCIYQAALALVKHANSDFLAVEWSRDMEILRSALTHFAKRWRLASLYINNIEKAISDAVNVRTHVTHENYPNNYSV